MKQIQIFATFDKDAAEDIVRFGDFLHTLNAQNKSVELSIFKNEKELCESLEQTNEQIDGKLNTCEYFLLILGSQNDEYILNKLNRAIENYAKTRGSPDIHIFVNAANKDADNVIRFFSSEKYEHFVEQFKHIDTLKAKFLIWLSAKEKDLTYEVDADIHGSPVIKVGGHPVSGLLDFDALLNNEDYQDEKKKLIRRRAEREKYIKELREAKGEERNDLWDDISALTKEIEEQQDKIAKMEKDTLALYQNYAKMTLESGYNSRLKRALECIERGELDRARKVLDPEGSINNLKAIENENEVLTARIETNKKIAEQEINILFAEIDRLKLDTENKNRNKEIRNCYENIEYFQEKLGLEITVLFCYANFLAKRNKHLSAIRKYTQELTRLKKLAEINPDTYLVNIATVLNNIAVSQDEIDYIEEAETNYNEALQIRRKINETNTTANSSSIAIILSNLAHLKLKTKCFLEAEANFIETMKIRRKLVEIDPIKYLPDLARTLSDLAFQYQYNATNRLEEAEKKYIEAVEIYRKLFVINNDKYIFSMASTLDSLAFLQESINHYKEAEENYIESLVFYRKLADIYPEKIILVGEALKKVASFYKNINRYKEAEEHFIESIKAYKKYSEHDPDCLCIVATAFEELASFFKNINNFKDAEINYIEALKINRKIVETSSYGEPQLANNLFNIATLQLSSKRYAEAEVNIIEVIEIRRKLANKYPIYLPDLASALNNLANIQTATNRNNEADANNDEAHKLTQTYETIQKNKVKVILSREEKAELLNKDVLTDEDLDKLFG